MKITTILIDDEPKALSILENKIVRHCPDLEIIAKTQVPEEGIRMIKELKPDLIFLDIAMPNLSGFDVLKSFEHPDFEIIFATAFDQYAVEAIKHCAIGYLVKPVDNGDLVKAVQSAQINIERKTSLLKNKQLIANLTTTNYNNKKIVVPSQEGLEFIEIKDIIYCEGVDGYTKIHIKDKKDFLSSTSIGHFVKQLNDEFFFHCHKSFLVNTLHVQRYLNEGYLTMSNGANVAISRSKRQEFISIYRK